MTKKRVLHFVRKSSQLKSSFIYNQIINHIDYIPYIVFRKKTILNDDKGFADFNLSDYTFLDLSEDENLYEKILFKTVKMLSFRQVRKIKHFISENSIEICHFHYGTDCGIYSPLLRQLDLPSVVSFYGYDCSSFPKYLFGYGKKYLQNRVFQQVTNVIAMSPDMKQDLVSLRCPSHKIIVHYYGTDTSNFFLARNYEQKNICIILILANLVPKKGHLFLLESIKRLIETGISNFQLRVVGQGILEQELKQYCLEHRLNNNVVFLGALKYASPEMMAEYKKADIFIHPSVIDSIGAKEGIPGTIIEALSSGVPVISTNHAGIPYVIETDVTGILVDEYDFDGMLNAIVKLMQNIDLRKSIGMAGQKYALNYLNVSSKERELEEIYNDIV